MGMQDEAKTRNSQGEKVEVRVDDHLRQIVGDTMTRILAQPKSTVDPHDVPEWSESVWKSTGEAGILESLAQRASVQGGLPAAAALEAVRVCGEAANHLPIPEAMLANRLLSDAQLNDAVAPLSLGVTADPLRLAAVDGKWRIEGQLIRVPWGRRVTGVVADAVDSSGRRYLVHLASDQWRTTKGYNLASAPRDDLSIAGPIDASTFAVAPKLSSMAAGAVARTIQIAGALQTVLAICIEHATSRVQFGKPIASFQVIQHQLAQLAEHVAAAEAAADLACTCFEASHPRLVTSIAKSRASEAAGAAVAIAHQIHGAIGLCEEHRLPRFTNALQSWRTEFGSEREHAEYIGREAISSPHLWHFLSSV